MNSAVHPLVVNGLRPSKECCSSWLRQINALMRNRPMLSDPIPMAVRMAPCLARLIVA